MPTRRITFCLLCFALSNFAKAETLPPMPARALDLQVRLQQLKSHAQINNGNLVGIYTSHYKSQRGIDLRIRYTGNFDPAVNLSWAFIGRDFEGDLFVYDCGEQASTLIKPEFKMKIVSKPLEGEVRNYAAIGVRRISGGKPAGVVVRVSQKGKTILTKATIRGTEKMLQPALAAKREENSSGYRHAPALRKSL